MLIFHRQPSLNILHAPATLVVEIGILSFATEIPYREWMHERSGTSYDKRHTKYLAARGPYKTWVETKRCREKPRSRCRYSQSLGTRRHSQAALSAQISRVLPDDTHRFGISRRASSCFPGLACPSSPEPLLPRL